jgi:hypothetical protein
VLDVELPEDTAAAAAVVAVIWCSEKRNDMVIDYMYTEFGWL